MKHYDVRTDTFVEVSALYGRLYMLYWRFCRRKFEIKVWFLKNIILLLGRGVFQELLQRPVGSSKAGRPISTYETAALVASSWFKGTDYDKQQ
jgi:hypothetical protein